jgi:carbonic anhydrase
MSIDQLISGYKSFHQDYYLERPEFYKNLVKNGQSPETMIIACSDSRVSPSIMSKADPGEIFMVRNVANLIPPYDKDSIHHGTNACIEFAVRDLGVLNIIVLGHSHCGGIKRLCDRSENDAKREFIDSWVSIAEKALDTNLEGDNKYRYVERRAIEISLENLLTFPWLKKKCEAGELELHGCLFDLESGKLFTRGVDNDWTTIT